MTSRVMRGVLAGWMAAGAAGATGIRTETIGGVDGAVADESAAFTLFSLNNAAGLGFLPRANRLDEALDVSSATDRNDNGSTRTTRSASVNTLGSPGGRYEGLTLWFSEADVVRGGIGHTGARTSLVTVPAFTPEDQKSTASDTRFLVQYARKLTESLALGAAIRPLIGSVGFPPAPGVTSDTTKYRLFDYNVGAGLLIPSEGSRLSLGINVQPFNDAPNPLDVLLPGAPPTGPSSFGGLKVERTVVTSVGLTQTFRLTPKGSVIGAQAVWNKGDQTEAMAGLDVTRAETEETQITDTGSFSGGGTKTDTAKVTTFARTRFAVAGRSRIALANDASVRLAAALRGEPASLDLLNFPTDTSVRSTTTTSPVTLVLGTAYATPGGFTLGIGFDRTGDTQTVVDHLGANPDRRTRVIGSNLRLGSEVWLNPRWAARLGLVLNRQESRSDDPDQPPPGTDPGNPVNRDTVLALGIGYKTAAVSLDAGLFIHSLTQDPPPDPPVTLTRGKSVFRVGGSWIF